MALYQKNTAEKNGPCLMKLFLITRMLTKIRMTNNFFPLIKYAHMRYIFFNLISYRYSSFNEIV
ncbi:hypothetical protein HZS_6012 [Henneguya salminicola]|nr:hypothetical protein HZS_6012 [Henneguya salminicola]